MTTHRRRRKHRPRRPPPGAPPGTIVPSAGAAQSRFQLFSYGPDALVERAGASEADLRFEARPQPLTWINVDGLGSTSFLQRLADHFGIHRLAFAEVINQSYRPKVEDFADHLFVVLRMPRADASFETEQISMILGQTYLLTFQETSGDWFDPIRERLRLKRGRVREAGVDYLAYTLISAAVDAYFPLVERMSDEVEGLEDIAVTQPDASLLQAMQRMKRRLLGLRREIWPLRELLDHLSREPSEFISDETRLYFRDAYTRCVHLVDLLDTSREIALSLTETYLNMMSLRLNETMKVLTIIATIFIPLSFVTGIYGMNFDRAASPYNMPELEWYFGYAFALALMAAIAASLLWYFSRRGWIEPPFFSKGGRRRGAAARQERAEHDTR